MKKLGFSKAREDGKFGKKSQVVLVLLLILVVVIGTSYALWQVTLRQTSQSSITTDCFKVEFSDENPITLGDAYPLSDVDGAKLVPYSFTVTNTCDSYVRYEANLEILDQTTLTNHDYIRAMYDEDTPVNLTEYESVEPTLNNAVNSYNLGFGYLEANQSKTVSLRLWLSEDTPLSDEVMNKTLSSKVTVTTSYAKNLPSIIRNLGNSGLMGEGYSNSITKIVVQNRLNTIDSAIRTYDLSEKQDKTIMYYIVPNEDGKTYTAYLQGQDVIYLNPDSSYLFRNFEKLEQIEGMKYLDTSKVTNMQNMFIGCTNLKKLDLSNFDTSNVTTMMSMFNGCSNLTSLDLSIFDTSQVINMSTMFGGCSNLTSLDLLNFDTSKVMNMSDMFGGCSNLTSLDLLNFDTSKVTNMDSMFAGCYNLTSLDLYSFDTGNVTTMADMFNGCRSLTSLNLSSFDTKNVTNMIDMFYISGGLVTIVYGDNFVHKDGAKITNMFLYCPANKPTHSSWNGVTF